MTDSLGNDPGRLLTADEVEGIVRRLCVLWETPLSSPAHRAAASVILATDLPRLLFEVVRLRERLGMLEREGPPP